MFVWAPIPEPYRELGSLEFAEKLVREARVAVSPGIGFGADGDGYVRFALVENEQRIGQAVRGIRKLLGGGSAEPSALQRLVGSRAGRRPRRAPSRRAREQGAGRARPSR